MWNSRRGGQGPLAPDRPSRRDGPSSNPREEPGYAALGLNLVARQPMSDLFGVKGRAWLAECVGGLALDERVTVGAGLRQIDFIAAELVEPAELAKILAADALSEPTRCG